MYEYSNVIFAYTLYTKLYYNRDQRASKHELPAKLGAYEHPNS